MAMYLPEGVGNFRSRAEAAFADNICIKRIIHDPEQFIKYLSSKTQFV